MHIYITYYTDSYLCVDWYFYLAHNTFSDGFGIKRDSLWWISIENLCWMELVFPIHLHIQLWAMEFFFHYWHIWTVKQLYKLLKALWRLQAKSFYQNLIKTIVNVIFYCLFFISRSSQCGTVKPCNTRYPNARNN